MTPAEFALWFIYLPWAAAFVGVASSLFMLIFGGSTLRTLISAKLDPAAQLVFAYTEGGLFTLEKRRFTGEHGLLEKGNKDFMLVNTPPNQVVYRPVMAQPKKDATPDEVAKINAENQSRIEEAARKTAEFNRLSEVTKKRGVFEGKPVWIGHRGLGVAINPEFLRKMQETKMRVAANAVVSEFTPLSVDTIKDYMEMNFSRKRLTSINREGVDEGKYGRPRQPVNPMLYIILIVAAILLIVGVLIATGKLDMSGWLKNMGINLGSR